jgi:Velvet factor
MYSDIDHGMFVLNVDLWSADGFREVNLVRHSATSPSISSTTPVSYAEVQAASSAAYSQILPSSGHFKVEPGQGHPGAPYNPYPGPPQVNPYAQPPGGQSYGGAPQYHQGYAPTTNGGVYPPQNGYSQGQPQPVYYTSGAGIHATGAGGQAPGLDYSAGHGQVATYGRPYTPADLNMPRMPVNSTAPQGMFTRNLIGSLAASAFRLTDPDDRIGIWFVLQDLSVRTEGTFRYVSSLLLSPTQPTNKSIRLRFSFVNVGVPGSPSSANPSSGSNAIPMTAVNTGKAPVLAACFSEVFTVYSAKRFPGVVESTNLSKCFATQGIKIPIRKDGPGKGDKNQEYDDDN